ncbi:MAG TPA: hypothetical protein VLG16_03620 [Candidatus Saccharimonadales bacterium]|nr:hypothetical protein [Candidatus Saccharimonadales bacterium]
MSNSLKQNIYGTLTVLGAVAMVVCIAKMIPYGLAGEIGKVKPYFAGMMAGLLMGLPSAIAYYYYRDKNQQADAQLDHLKAQVDIFAHAGQKTNTPPKKPRL